MRNHIARDGSNVGGALVEAIRKIQINSDPFTTSYIESALVLMTDDPNQYSIDDLAPETLGKIIADCQRFQLENSAALKTVYAIETCIRGQMQNKYSPMQAGHDFWLTRNGHGAGFWDRGLGDQGVQLSKACGWRSSFPGVELYVGDDGRIYQS
jgi:hypothetical protein